MRRLVVGLSLGALALASACATSTGSMSGSRFDTGPSSERPTRRSARDIADSMLAQAVADREGPRVDIRAEFTNISSSRRMRAAFSVHDDAYVLVAHVDADGNVRIVFPQDPKDDGFVRGGNRSYETNEFFAGFTDAYRYRYNNYGRYASYRPESYDGAFGYLFIVASWRPMHFEQFAGENGWDSFEVTDVAYARDPRPAIYELAALLAGENREAYTVKFARYSNTQNYASPFGQRSAYGYGMCGAGYSSMWQYGFGSSPFDSRYMMTMGGYGSSFYYRGRPYVYSAFGDCYNVAPYGGYGYGSYYQPRIAQTPVLPPGSPTGSRPRVLAAEDAHRTPIDPRPLGGKLAPVAAQDVGPSNPGQTARFSPQYRQRGLITEDEPGARAPGRAPRVGVEQERTRPSIQQMVERRVQNQNEGNGWSRPQAHVNGSSGSNGDARQNWSRPTASEPRGRAIDNGGNGYSRPAASDNARSVPQRSEPSPRIAAPESRSSSPPPAAPTPRAEPASSGSGVRPITPTK